MGGFNTFPLCIVCRFSCIWLYVKQGVGRSSPSTKAAGTVAAQTGGDARPVPIGCRSDLNRLLCDIAHWIGAFPQLWQTDAAVPPYRRERFGSV